MNKDIQNQSRHVLTQTQPALELDTCVNGLTIARVSSQPIEVEQKSEQIEAVIQSPLFLPVDRFLRYKRL